MRATPSGAISAGAGSSGPRTFRCPTCVSVIAVLVVVLVTSGPAAAVTVLGEAIEHLGAWTLGAALVFHLLALYGLARLIWAGRRRRGRWTWLARAMTWTLSRALPWGTWKKIENQGHLPPPPWDGRERRGAPVRCC